MWTGFGQASCFSQYKVFYYSSDPGSPPATLLGAIPVATRYTSSIEVPPGVPGTTIWFRVQVVRNTALGSLVVAAYDRRRSVLHLPALAGTAGAAGHGAAFAPSGWSSSSGLAETTRSRRRTGRNQLAITRPRAANQGGPPDTEVSAIAVQKTVARSSKQAGMATVKPWA